MTITHSIRHQTTCDETGETAQVEQHELPLPCLHKLVACRWNRAHRLSSLLWLPGLSMGHIYLSHSHPIAIYACPVPSHGTFPFSHGIPITMTFPWTSLVIAHNKVTSLALNLTSSNCSRTWDQKHHFFTIVEERNYQVRCDIVHRFPVTWQQMKVAKHYLLMQRLTHMNASSLTLLIIVHMVILSSAVSGQTILLRENRRRALAAMACCTSKPSIRQFWLKTRQISIVWF